MRYGIVLFAVLGVLVSFDASAEIRSVRVRKANFRERPSLDAEILFTADRYYPVDVLERKRGWARIRDFEGEEAWVAERLLSATDSVVVTVDHANVREAPRANARVLFEGVRTEAYPVKDLRGVWVQIETQDGERGWIHRSIVWGDEEVRKD